MMVMDYELLIVRLQIYSRAVRCAIRFRWAAKQSATTATTSLISV